MKKFDELMSVGSEIENITAEEAKKKLNDSNVQFIDVRDTAEATYKIMINGKSGDTYHISTRKKILLLY
jgi:nucleoside-diphosphate-sugar epimerase